MKKVFHDLHRWKKRWFKKLGAEGRDVWNWLLDAVYETYGVWEIDLEDMGGDLGYPVTMDTIRRVFGSRIHEFGDQKLFIADAIIFQYGELSEACKPHKSVIRELRRLGLYELYLKELANSMETVSIPSKNKNKNNTNTNLGNEESEEKGNLDAKAQAIFSRLPIITQETISVKYPPKFLKEGIEECVSYFVNEPGSANWQPGVWGKKITAWLVEKKRREKDGGKSAVDFKKIAEGR